MAKTKTSKSKTSIFLCCFRSHLPKKPSTHSSNPKQKRSSWFSWTCIKIKTKSTSKTVPFEASLAKVENHYSKKTRSKSSTLHKSKTLPATPQPLSQPSPVLPATPYYSPTQTRHGPNNNTNADNTWEQGRATPIQLIQQERRLSSAMQNQTTSNYPKNVRRSYDPIVGMSILVVTLVIMIFWGRFCAILCTSAWLYFIPRLRNSGVNDEDELKIKSRNDLDLDSEEYKKKVIMKGLLGRNKPR